MRTLRGPALFLAQFAGDEAPFDSSDAITRWAAEVGYVGVQIPTLDARLFDLGRAAESQDYCDEIKGVAAANGVGQQLHYLEHIDIYHERIRMFHVKDAEFNPTGRQGVYSGYAPWVGRAGRFRSPGDGQVDFGAVFSKLAAYDFDGWAVVEWECCLKHPEDGAREGADFVRRHIIPVTEKAFDDFAGRGNRRGRQPADARDRVTKGSMMKRGAAGTSGFSHAGTRRT